MVVFTTIKGKILMQVTIKNPHVEASVRELAKRLGLGLTATIREAVLFKLMQLESASATTEFTPIVENKAGER
jgi:hypothetical protein